MKNVKRALVALLALYLALSLAASAVMMFSNNRDVTRWISTNRYVLLVCDYDPTSETFVILSPFCNYYDVFLLIVDFSEGIDICSDGFDYFGEW